MQFTTAMLVRVSGYEAFGVSRLLGFSVADSILAVK